jgi:N-acyl amino acid synthase of PEP-CTERM/exosortase system
MSESLSSQELEILGDIFQEGALLSGRKLSKFGQGKWKVSFSGIRTVSGEKIPEFFKLDFGINMGATIGIAEPLFFEIVMLFPEWSLIPLEKSIAEATGMSADNTDDKRPIFSEVANILGHGILGAMADYCGEAFISLAPKLAHGTKQEIVAMATKRMPENAEAILTHAEFFSDAQACAATVIVLADAAALKKALPKSSVSAPKEESLAPSSPKEVKMQSAPNSNFQVLCVQDPQDLKDVFRLRYQVYVVERGFLNPADYSNDLEKDIYDESSIHFLVRDSQGLALGTTRLVLDSKWGFPIEKEYDITKTLSQIDRKKLGEFSRFAIPRNIHNESSTSLNQSRSGHSEIALALILALFQKGQECGLTHICAAIERALWLALRRGGTTMHQIGEPTDYHGIRIPCLLPLEECVNLRVFPFPKEVEAFYASRAKGLFGDK